MSGRLPGLASRRTTAAWRERDVLERVQVGEQQRVLGQERDLAEVWRDHGHLVARDAGEIATSEAHVARVRPQQAGDDGQDGGLARAVGAEKRHGLAVADGELRIQTSICHRPP